MKVAYRDTESFVRSPPSDIAVILLYGPDYGLMRERSDLIAKTVVEDLTDPFNVSLIATEALAEDGAKLNDEANAVSMMGGRRLVKIEAATDKITPAIKDYIQNPNSNCLVLVEAGELGPRSQLRTLCEKDKKAASLACYVEEARDLVSFISTTIKDAGYSIDRDALAWLSTALIGDRRRVRSELEKLQLYKGPEKTPISLSDAQAACGDASIQSFDELCYALSAQNTEVALRIFHSMLEDGVPVISLMRALQNHFRRLLTVKQLINSGEHLYEAKKALSPPLFFKVEKMFESHVTKWSEPALLSVLKKFLELESQSKKTGYDTETGIGQLIAGIGLSKVA